jgi:hypothetical protein
LKPFQEIEGMKKEQEVSQLVMIEEEEEGEVERIVKSRKKGTEVEYKVK